MPGAHLDCPTGEPEDPCNSRGKAYTQGDDGAPPEPVLWVRRPAAALASTHAITPWGTYELQRGPSPLEGLEESRREDTLKEKDRTTP